MTTDMNRLIIETTVRHTLSRLIDSPEREIRNLIDMGMEFSEGRFQKQIFSTAQTMLQNPSSAYYTLVKQAAGDIAHERLLHFGMNLGYESCTKGARTIRDIEAKEHFNIPWALSLSLAAEKAATAPDLYERILKECTELGIYTALILVNDALDAVIPLVQSQPDMAFVLFINGAQISDDWLERLDAVNNVMICVADDANTAQACDKLHQAKMLYGIYRTYNEDNLEDTVSEAWLDTLKALRPTFVILASAPQCARRVSNEVFNFTRRIRESQHYPFVLMALQQDLQLIDQIISDDLCMVGFDSHGMLHTIDGLSDNPSHNIFTHSLKDILQDALKK